MDHKTPELLRAQTDTEYWEVGRVGSLVVGRETRGERDRVEEGKPLERHERRRRRQAPR